MKIKIYDITTASLLRLSVVMFFLSTVGCGVQEVSNTGNIIKFPEAIGSYNGTCTALNSQGDTLTSESSSLVLSAFNLTSATFKPSCESMEEAIVDYKETVGDTIFFSDIISGVNYKAMYTKASKQIKVENILSDGQSVFFIGQK